jgi:hypothetical protein
MSKKILFAILLLAIVVAVSYYRTSRQQDDLSAEYQKGITSGRKDLTPLQKRSDSLGLELAETRAELADSLRGAQSRHDAEVDSLGRLLATKDRQIAQLSQRKPTRTAAKTSAKPDSTALSGKHAQILAYYKKRLQALPADLSDYERRVAVNEVRDDVTKKFSISTTELEKICKSANLTN